MKGLYYVRKKLGLTQSELGDRVGIDPNTISRYEREQLNATNKTAMKIAQKLGVSVDELLREPAEEDWVLEIKIADSKEEVIDMTGTMPCVAAITGTQSGANLQLSAKWETFRDDAKFQDFIDQVTRARGLLLEMGAGMEKLKGKEAKA